MVANPSFTASLVVAATASTRAIGRDGGLPWQSLPGDLANFKALTLNHVVVMGSNTYFSLPPSVRPLPGRINLVLSSRPREALDLPDNVLLAGSLDAAEHLLAARGIHTAFVIGGEQIYRAALDRPNWSQRVFYTEVYAHVDADCFFPADLRADDSAFDLVSLSADRCDNAITYRFAEFLRRGASASSVPSIVSPHPVSKPVSSPPHEEMQYIELVRHILQTGAYRPDRTGTGTLSVFGASMRFSLRDDVFPLLTTKRVFWRGVAEELLWFIRGSTNANELAAKGVRIWDANGSRSFLDQRGFVTRDEGDLGPVYGFQWRHFGADYTSMHADYSGQGVDQLAHIIHTLKTNPSDRRVLLSAWNPAALSLMALPPCHLLAQFYVADGELSCQMYQRSADMGLGVPFNIASYALLTRLIAIVTGLKPGEFVHVLGDAHVYSNHVDALKVQIERAPREFPKLRINRRENIEEFCFDDLTLEGYEPHDTIKMQMAV